MFYSKSTNGFYSEVIHEGIMPADVVEITEEQYTVLLDGQGQGKVITADDQGHPVLTAPVPPALPILIERAKAKVRGMRAPAFAALAGIQSQALANSETTTAKAISKIQDQLKAITDTDLKGLTTEAQIDAAFVAAWLAIVASAPANVASAFNGIQP